MLKKNVNLIVTIAARKVTEINNKSLSNLSVEEYELVGNNF